MQDLSNTVVSMSVLRIVGKDWIVSMRLLLWQVLQRKKMSSLLPSVWHRIGMLLHMNCIHCIV